MKIRNLYPLLLVPFLSHCVFDKPTTISGVPISYEKEKKSISIVLKTENGAKIECFSPPIVRPDTLSNIEALVGEEITDKDSEKITLQGKYKDEKFVFSYISVNGMDFYVSAF